MSDDAKTWAMIHAERKALAATLEGLTPEQWGSASLFVASGLPPQTPAGPTGPALRCRGQRCRCCSR